MKKTIGAPVKIFNLLQLLLLLLLLHSCHPQSPDIDKDFHFTQLTEKETNIDFNNQITENDSINFLTNQYIYIGSGVGVADFNNDGLQDIFFAGEQVSCKLYINKGGFKFEDKTADAGLATTKWCAGVSIVDINGDGLKDIYVCVSHSPKADQRKNLLFVNQGNLKFKEQAAEYGLDNSGFSTQAAFFDYDKDGDLDMYLMNHNVFQNQPNNIVNYDAQASSVASDKLFKNEGIPPGANHPFFKDVSVEAGIREWGYGLGLAISDIDNDGWPDIYVANDFLSNDLLWMNNHDGTFTNNIAECLHHQSFNSMGIDIADFNNDQLPDIAVMDMQPEKNYRKKTMFSGTNHERYEIEQKFGDFQPQFSRNMLHLNNGNRHFANGRQPFFSEIGQYAGISETDWSWSVLMADFDNDGWKDMHVTNGLAKDLTSNDFLFFRSEQRSAVQESKPGTGFRTDSLLKDLDAYGSIKINNYFFHNNGDLSFTNTTRQTGMAVPSISHGAAYADLDNDGDLDLVINNMNQPAFIWKNELRKTATDTAHNFLSIQLEDTGQNRSGTGSKAVLYTGGKVQFLEQNNTRGYLSSVDDRLHFGVGNVKEIDSLKIVWPDGRKQLLKKIRSNQTLTVNHKDASEMDIPVASTSPTLFSAVDSNLHIRFRHDENSFFDFGVQQLLPQKYSQLGPPVITADINGDGLMDFFVGGASYQSGLVFIQNNDGIFTSSKLVPKDKTGEDAAAVFFDADNDHDMDLVIMESSTEFVNTPSTNMPRLYKNDGKGNFTQDESAFPSSLNLVSKVIATGDYDGDGDLDIFLGGRVLANQYPVSPRSYILRNNHGIFTDVTADVCKELIKPGMITAAVWTDFNNDKQADLVICGDWMPVRFFKNNKGRLEEVTSASGLKNMNGQWRSIEPVDIDKDGDLDFIVGNMGLNNKFHTTPEHPELLYAKDIDGNGTIDLLPAYYIQNDEGKYELFPGLDRTQFAEQVPVIKKKYLLNKNFAKINMEELLKAISRENLLEMRCETMASCWLENLGNGQYRNHPLPVAAQMAPVNAILATDVDGDGITDLLLAGNEYQAEVSRGRYDASYGLFLKNDGKGTFTAIPPAESGFILDGEVKGLKMITTKNKERLVIAAVNNDWLKCFKINTADQK